MSTADEKLCELPGCEEIMVRPSNVSRKVHAARRYHNRACAEQAKKLQGGHRSKEPSITPGTPYQHRYNAEGTWRPNAPGWPDFPRVPVDHSTRQSVDCST